MGGGAPFYVYLNGRNQGELYSGQCINIPIDVSRYTSKICANMGDGKKYWSNEYQIFANERNVSVSVSSKTRLTTVDIYIM